MMEDKITLSFREVCSFRNGIFFNLRIAGLNEEAVKKFSEDFQAWLNKGEEKNENI